jgi:hypothetical protein
MHYQQHGPPYSADPLPTLLAVDHSIFPKPQIWIGEYPGCGLEIDAGVFLLV